MLCQPFCLFAGLLFVLEPGVEDADIVDIIFEVCGLVIFDEHDLTFRTEAVLLALPGHLPLALLPGGGRILVCIPENAHFDLPVMNDRRSM